MHLTANPAHIGVGVMLALAASVALAQSPAWQVDSQSSSLGFTATQEGAPFQGTFEAFSADIRFQPDDPANGMIQATIALGSVNTQNEERDSYLTGTDFFAVDDFPEARFQSTAISATGEGEFEARAQLTIRDVTREVIMPFQWAPQPGGTARFTATVPLQRLDFGIGQGIWSDTRWIGAQVLVEVDLTLRP